MRSITSQESPVDYERVSGLQVRGYYSDLKIPIPVAYTSTSIPADEDHIPTTTNAKNWSHLRPIKDKMLDLLECNVGSLVGYACSQALTLYQDRTRMEHSRWWTGRECKVVFPEGCCKGATCTCHNNEWHCMNTQVRLQGK